MRVSSPIGEFPFNVERVRWRDGLRVDGRLGTWRVHVRLEAADLRQLARLVPPKAKAVLAGALVLALLLRSNRGGPG